MRSIIRQASGPLSLRVREPNAPRWRAWLSDEAGTTSLEWALLLAAIALPCYFIFKMLLATLIEYYRMMTTINALPYP